MIPSTKVISGVKVVIDQLDGTPTKIKTLKINNVIKIAQLMQNDKQ